MRKYTEEQQKAQVKYESESIPNHIAIIGFIVLALLITLADNIFN